MALRLYNTLTKTKEEFTPLDAKNVRMYVCGPTVYDYAHIGNARPAIVFDVLFRLLRHLHGPEHVTYVRNITDVDDKIIKAAEESGETIEELTKRTADQFHDDIRALGVLMPEDVNLPGQPKHFYEPRATEYIPQMIAMIEKLIAERHAYPAEGHVLYDVSSKSDYGKLSRRSVNEMIAGARVEIAPYKKDPMDFVLWKPSKAGEPAWDSPWGRGRPGWHVECSAMSGALLGETFDIHGGGIDLMFPHHENEIAQSESAHGGHPLANIWMHNGFLQVEGEKMSKSAGNFVTIRDALAREHPDVIRLQMLMTHYRQPIDWTESRRKQARAKLKYWYRFTDGFYPLDLSSDELTPIFDALKDDLNTPEALSRFSQTLSPMALKAAANFLGLLNSDLPTWQRWGPSGTSVDECEVGKLIDARNDARGVKDFKEADRIRDELLEKGIVLKDNADGTTTWEVKQ